MSLYHMQGLIDLGVFAVETIILVAAILVVVGGIFALAAKSKKQQGHWNIKNLSTDWQDLKLELSESINDKAAQKALHKKIKQIKKQAKESPKNTAEPDSRRTFVLNFNGDVQANAVMSLRQEVTAILAMARPTDCVLLKLESPGGAVSGYGLAASQLERLRRANLKLVVAVDKVAASGGYMMAAVANTILAAPFAIIGSIGVVAQLPNFHRWLKQRGIDFEQITAGEYKRTLTVFGENTQDGREKMEDELAHIHDQFKQHISHYRPNLKLNEVATGEFWLAEQAKKLDLIDVLQTSDDYIFQAIEAGQSVFSIQYQVKQSKMSKLFGKAKAEMQQLGISQLNL